MPFSEAGSKAADMFLCSEGWSGALGAVSATRVVVDLLACLVLDQVLMQPHGEGHPGSHPQHQGWRWQETVVGLFVFSLVHAKFSFPTTSSADL